MSRFRRVTYAVVGLAALAVISEAVYLTSDAIAREQRFTQLRIEDLNGDQREVGEKILRISSVGIGGPYNPMLRSPLFAKNMFSLLDYVRWHSSLPPKLSELAILVQARLWRSQVEWYAHYPLAIKAGLSEKVAADLKASHRPDGMTPEEAIVYDFCTEISVRRSVSDETFHQAKTLLGEQQTVDLIAVTGAYVTVAMLLAAGDDTLPPDKELPFPLE